MANKKNAKKKPDTVCVGTHLSKETHGELKKIAAKRGNISVSAVIRIAVSEFIDRATV